VPSTAKQLTITTGESILKVINIISAYTLKKMCCVALGMYCNYIFICRMEKITKQNNIVEMCLSMTSAPGHYVVQNIEFKNQKDTLILYHPSLNYMHMPEYNVSKLGVDKTFNIFL
jgi:hypothetical protein